ncbi:MAG: FAD-dependent oxidoreductase [Acidobacteriota bacterium]|nr:FAD-dependent oxidoreductase [Acidobacteriota bacterium]
MLPWLIIGGGLHGTYLSLVLTKGCSMEAKQVRVLDAEAEPLAQWFHRTANTGMTHLRSPIVHHIDLEPGSLKKFSRNWRQDKCCIAPYARPSLAMFNAHCREVIERNGLAELRIQGTARHIEIAGNHVCVETNQGAVRARRVVLAMGSTPPSVPVWAERLSAADAQIHHLFDEEFKGADLATSGTTLVIGGGISGAQFASYMVERGAEQVVVLARSQPRVHQFDADPGWLGPKYMGRFNRYDPPARRPLITAARHKGSMPGDVFRRLRHHLRQERVTWLQGEVRHASTNAGRIMVQCGQGLIVADRLVLATGFIPTVPGKPFLQDMHRQAGLTLAPCGFPITDRFLRWHSRVFVTGGLGELTLGPVARNIAGARRAANLIKQLVRPT